MMLQDNPETTTNLNDPEAITPGEFMEKTFDDSQSVSLSDPDSLSNLGSTVVNWLFIFAMFVAIGSLIFIAIRIMFARATGDVDAAKTSSNGIGWVIGAVILIFSAPAIIMFIVNTITTN